MIDNVYDLVRAKLLNLKLKEAEDYFDKDNVPDSLTDKGFCIAPIEFDVGDRYDTKAPVTIINLGAKFSIFLSVKLPVNKWGQKNKDISLLKESIIRNILSIDIGSNEIDDIFFNGSSESREGTILISEIDFTINYRA